MTKQLKNYLTLAFLFALLLQKTAIAQDIHVKIGFRDSIKSEILQENRNILIHLPHDYFSSNKSYPIMYLLDGNEELLFETTAIVNRIALREETMPDLILVVIENTNRPRDMWPTNTKYYPEPHKAGAKDFLNFIEKELIPYIETKYRSNEEKILCGQSLSAVFTLYAFLKKPQLFSSYIASSGAFPLCEDYFKELSLKSFQQKEQFNDRKLFITNGLKDELDPDGKMNQIMIDFTNSVKESLGNRILIKYVSYEDEGHVPFQSIYHGLKFVLEPSKKD